MVSKLFLRKDGATTGGIRIVRPDSFQALWARASKEVLDGQIVGKMMDRDGFEIKEVDYAAVEDGEILYFTPVPEVNAEAEGSSDEEEVEVEAEEEVDEEGGALQQQPNPSPPSQQPQQVQSSSQAARQRQPPLHRPRSQPMRGCKRIKRTVIRDSIQGVTGPAIRRMARRGGVKRITGLIYEETRGVTKAKLAPAIEDAVKVTKSKKEERKTVKQADVLYALKRAGKTLLI